MDTQTKIFVDGLFIKDIPDSAPEFILGAYSINVEKFKSWLDQNQEAAVKGWINITIKKSKGGSKYAELDTWKQSESHQNAENAPTGYDKFKSQGQSLAPENQPISDEDLAESVPF